MILRKVFIFISIIIFITTSQAQEEFQEQIEKLDFKTIYSRFETYYNDLDSINALRYAEAYYIKARKTKDTNHIADGYYYRALIDKEYKSLHLYDSIISLTSDVKKSNYPTIAYLQKGYYFVSTYQYDKALENFIQASIKNHGKNKENLALRINISITELQIRIEENNKALTTLKKIWKETVDVNYKTKNPDIYNEILFGLANANRKLHHIDTSNTYINLGLLTNDTKNKESNYYYYFLLLKGINELSNDFNGNIPPKLKTAINYMNRVNFKENIALAYHYIGEAYHKKGEEEKALQYFFKVDSLTEKSASILPETLGSYNYIRDYYKKSKDVVNELIYVKKIIAFDSILDINYKSINNKIRDKYELPTLIEKYNQDFATLEKQNSKSNTLVIILYSISSITFIVLFYVLFQRNKYKRRFKQLQESSLNKRLKKTSSKEKPDLPEKVFIKVKNCLDAFEKEQQFLNHAMNSEKLAQQIGTNRPYFAKAFNYYKNESFNVYLRNLRLNYALERLRDDHIFRKYTIKTIANESGFGNSESFSKYFFKAYGIYPSFYIKSLNNENQRSNRS
ncbi:hypothetical protein GCM10011344_38140 [Dokdonia pacifica]|nr:AraC family transcriptional regulator [Dokdonia pacifica]GGG33698.1 hypothetical protein GCM10011344_38140 [Dokdonia pacifica]